MPLSKLTLLFMPKRMLEYRQLLKWARVITPKE
jgi:hypothetical protein